MPSTPHLSHLTTIKVSPYNSSINKSLLTPCRQIGLSRNRKTPNSLVKIYPAGRNDSPSTETTPVVHRKSISRRKSGVKPDHLTLNNRLGLETTPKLEATVFEENGTKIERANKASKRQLLQSLSSQDLFDTNEEKISKTPKRIYSDDEDPVVNVKIKVTKRLSSDEESDAKELTPNNLNDNISENVTQNDIGSDKIESNISNNTVSKTIKQSSTDSVSNIYKKASKQNLSHKSTDKLILENEIKDNWDDDFVISETKQEPKQEESSNKKSKRIRKSLSTKNSYMSISISDDDFDDTAVTPGRKIKKCAVKLQRLSEEQIKLTENITEEKPSQRTCTQPIDAFEDEDDAFTSTPDQERREKRELIKIISALEEKIKQKRGKLADLKQASIYKHKHDIVDLKNITCKWKTGCVAGLNDLLKQLQTHGPMDMATLISNLHIPKEIVAKLSTIVE